MAISVMAALVTGAGCFESTAAPWPVVERQGSTVTGTVTDMGGNPLPGVNVVVKGSTNGTVTDADGRYTINVPAVGKAVLMFSFVGYTTQEIAVDGQTSINPRLEEGTELEEVVVTALGIKRERKTVGYAMQEVKTDNLLDTKTESVANMLQGKVAGVQISQSATGVHGSTRIVMRGTNSISGSNGPLWVVDGIPVRDDANGASLGEYAGNDAAGAASEINPDDIESISVLKGPNAAALYGSRAQNGVIVITTKTARQEQPFKVTYNGNFSWSQMYGGYDYQWDYGQGIGGSYDVTNTSAWGPRMTGQMISNWRKYYYQDEAADYAMLPQKERINDFFRTGFNLSNSVAIEGGGKHLASRFSFTDLRTQGITPNNDLNRQNFDMGTNYRYGRLTVSLKVAYNTQKVLNPVPLGLYGIMQQFVSMPANIRTEDLEHALTPDYKPMNWAGNNIMFANPYTLISPRMENNQRRNRLMASASVNFRITDWLGVTGRMGQDYLMYNNYSYGLKSNSGQNPTYYRSMSNLRETNSDMMLNINKIFGDFSILSNLGASMMVYKNESMSGDSGPLNLYGFFALQNGTKIGASSGFTNKEIHSLLGNVQFGFRDYLFLEVTARNDWSSALPAANRSYFYPSVSLSAIISDMVTMPEAITFLKVRGSWAQVGADTSPYRTSAQYSLGTKYNNSLNYAEKSGTKPFDDIKPEQTTSTEFGFDFRMFQNRVGLDFTWYRSSTVNQILSLNTPASSGYTKKYINAGEMQSRGFEVMLATTPVQTVNWQWDLNFNYGRNRSECIDLQEGQPYHELGSLRIGRVVVTNAGSYGDIMSRVYERDNNGKIMVDDNGLPVIAKDWAVIGNFTPKWTGSVSNVLSYKNFTLSALIDIRSGGDLISCTDALSTKAGTSARTVDYRDGGLTVDGTVKSTGAANTKSITAEDYWLVVGGVDTGVGEEFLYSGSYVKMRELSLGWQLPAAWLSSTRFIKSARIALAGRDLFYFMKKTPGTDPEGASIRSDWAQGFELNALPSTRNFAINVNLTF